MVDKVNSNSSAVSGKVTDVARLGVRRADVKSIRVVDTDMVILLTNGKKLFIRDGAVRAMMDPNFTLAFTDEEMLGRDVLQQAGPLESTPLSTTTASETGSSTATPEGKALKQGSAGLTEGAREVGSVAPAAEGVRDAQSSPLLVEKGFFASLNPAWGAVGALGALGGGGGSGAAATADSSSAVVSGVVMLGPALTTNDLKIVAYDAAGNVVGITSAISSAGAYSIKLTAGYRGVVILKLTDTGAGLDYADEATAISKSLGNTQLRAVTYVNGSLAVVNITPLTELAALKMSTATSTATTTLGNPTYTGSATELVQINKAVASAFKLSNDEEITALLPRSTVDANGQTTATANGYGAVLAILSGAETQLGQTTQQVLSTLSAGLTVNQTAGTGAVGSSATSTLISGASVVAGQVSTATAGSSTAIGIVNNILDITSTDVIPPTVTAVTDNVSASVANGAIIFTVTLSEALGVTLGTGHFIATNGSVDSVSKIDDTHYAVHVTPSANLASGSVALSIQNLGVVVDLNSNLMANANLASFDTQAIDTLAPSVSGVVSISGVNSSNVLKTTPLLAGDKIKITVSLTEAVTVSGTPTFDVNVGGTTCTATYSASSSTATSLVFYYVVSISDALSTGAGGVTALANALTLPVGSSVVDLANNAANLSTALVASGANSLAVDNNLPSVISVTDNVSANITNAATTFEVTLSTALSQDLTSSNFTVSNGAVTAVTKVSATVYHVTATPTAGVSSGTMNLSLIAGGATSLGGRPLADADLSINGLGGSQAIDTLAPTLAITSDVSALKAGQTATITFTFSETPVGFVDSNIVVTGGTLSAITGTGTTRTATFTPTAGLASGSASITVLSGNYTDAALNDGGAGTTPSITIDTLAPTLAITSDVAALKAGQTATITFTFSEAPVGFVDSDIAVTGGTLSAITGTGTTRTATFTPTAGLASGSASITVLSGNYTDAATNTGGAGTTPSITIDTLAPTLAITSDVSALKAGQTATITFTFSEAPVGFVDNDIAVTGGTLSAITGTGTTRTATFTPTAGLASGSASITVLSGNYTDAATNTGGAGTTPSISIDTLAPSVVISSDRTTLNASQTATITFTFSEDPGASFVWDGTSGDVVVGGGTLSAISGTGLTRTATFTPLANQTSGNASITVITDSYTDAASNSGSAGASPSLSLDTVAPTVLSVTDNVSALVTNAAITFTVTLSETLGQNLTSSNFTASNGTVTAVSKVDATHYNVTVTPTTGVASSAVALSVVSGGATDLLGNALANADLSSLDSQSIDTLAPTAPVVTNPVVPNLSIGSARYVMVRKNAGLGSSSAVALSLAELQVFGTQTGATNLAGGKAVTVSTAAGVAFTSGSAAMLTDGTGGVNWQSAVTANILELGFSSPPSSADSSDLWMQIDLGALFPLASAVLWGPNTSKAGNWTVFFSDTSMTGLSYAQLLASSTIKRNIQTASTSMPNGVTLNTVSGALYATSPDLTGTGEVGALVQVYQGTSLLGSTTVASDGTWTLKLSTLTATGAYTLTVKLTDTVGNASVSTTTVVNVDATYIPVPVLASATDSGVVGDGVTNFTLPTLTGSGVTANANVRLYDNTTLVGTATANSNGAWTATLTTPLGAGAHNLSVKELNAGNVEIKTSPSMTITVDTSIIVPVLSVLTSARANALPVLSGTGEAGATLTLSAISNDGLTALSYTTVVGSNSTWSLDLNVQTTVLPANKTYVFTTMQTDVAGNVSSVSGGQVFHYDTSANAPVVNSPTAGGIVGSVVVVSGTGEVGATLLVKEGVSTLGTTTVRADGTWGVALSGLSSGAHALAVSQTDVANNSSAATSLNVTVDTAPVVPLAPVLMLASDTGVVGDNTTNMTTPTLTGQAIANASLEVWDTFKGVRVLVGSPLANSGGVWTLALSSQSEGEHHYTVNVAGASSGSVATVVTIDTTTPIAPSRASFFSPVFDTGTFFDAQSIGIGGAGAVRHDKFTTVSAQKLTGKADPYAWVSVYNNGSTLLNTVQAGADGVWVMTMPTVLSGYTPLTVKQSDAAGNVSAASVVFDFQIGNSTATPTITTPTTFTAQPIVTGTAAAGAWVEVFMDDVQVSGRYATNSGQWSLQLSNLLSGTHSLKVRATDLYGNVSVSQPTLYAVNASLLGTPMLSALTDSVVQGDGLTQYTTNVLTGRGVTPGATVDLYDTSTNVVNNANISVTTKIGSVLANAQGVWTYTGVFKNGSHSVVVNEMNGGVAVKASTAAVFTVDGYLGGAAWGDTATVGSVAPTPVIGVEVPAIVKIKATNAAGVVQTFVSQSVNGGIYSNIDGLLANDTYVFSWAQLDAAGNWGSYTSRQNSTNTPRVFAYDTLAAAPTISGPAAGATIGSVGVMHGVAEAGATVRVYDGNTPLGTALVRSDGTWGFTLSGLTSGDHLLAVEQTDLAGNLSLQSSRSITVDTSALIPLPPVLSLGSDSGVIGDGVVGGTSFTLTGQVAAGTASTVEVWDSRTNALVTSVTSNAGTGVWSASLTSQAEGSHSYYAKVGSNASAATALTVDTFAPGAPSSPELLLNSTSSVVVGSRSTTLNLPTFTGLANPDTWVSLYNGSTLLGQTQADAQGVWRQSVALADGSYSIKAKQTDAAGNSSAASAVVPVVVNATSYVNQLPPVTLYAGYSYGSLAGVTPSVTNLSWGTARYVMVRSETYGGVWAYFSALSELVVKDASLNNVAQGKTISTYGSTNVSNLVDGNTSTNTPALGNYTGSEWIQVDLGSQIAISQIELTAPNASGFLVLASSQDMSSRTLTQLEVSSDVRWQKLDTVVGGTQTMTTARSGVYSAAPIISGTGATAFSTIEFFENAVSLGKTSVNSGGGWQFQPLALTATGVHNLTALLTDAQGNKSEASPFAVEVGTGLSTPALAAVSDSGLQGDLVTSSLFPVLTGGGATPGATVRILDRASWGTVTTLGNAIADGNGNWSFTVAAFDSSIPVQGGHEVYAQELSGSTVVKESGRTIFTVDSYVGYDSVTTSKQAPFRMYGDLGQLRYVMVRKNAGLVSTDVSVSLSEIEVMSNGVNVAAGLGASAFTSLNASGAATQLTDGVGSRSIAATTNYAQPALTLTSTAADTSAAWVQLDLGAAYAVDGVQVFTLDWAANAARNNYSVFASAVDMSGMTFAQLNASSTVWKQSETVGTSSTTPTLLTGSTASGAGSDAVARVYGMGGEQLANVEVFENGVSLGKTTVGDLGKWSVLLNLPLDGAAHTLSAVQTDLQGNTLNSDANLTYYAPFVGTAGSDAFSVGSEGELMNLPLVAGKQGLDSLVLPTSAVVRTLDLSQPSVNVTGMEILDIKNNILSNFNWSNFTKLAADTSVVSDGGQSYDMLIKGTGTVTGAGWVDSNSTALVGGVSYEIYAQNGHQILIDKTHLSSVVVL